MEAPKIKKDKNNHIVEKTTFTIPFNIQNIKGDFNTQANISNKQCEDDILRKAFDFHSKGNTEEAARFYTFLINKGINNPRVFSNLGVILKQDGKIDKAIELYQKSIILFPDSAEAYCNLGNIYKEQGKLSKAEEITRKAIELNPSFTEALMNLVEILRDFKKLSEGENYIRKAIKIKPNEAKFHWILGNILYELGKLEEAELATRRAIKIKPNFFEAYTNLGGILKKNGKLKEAELAILKSIKINPKFADSYLNLGSIMRANAKLKEAKIATLKAIKINPFFAEAYSNLGGILRELGELREAEKFLHKSLEINPNLASPHYIISTFKNSEKNIPWKESIFSKKILLEKNEQEKIQIYFARANILHREKNYDESSKYLSKANELKLQLKPSNLKALLNKSKALIIESSNLCFNRKEISNSSENIFIVGMFRSGSTLIESIISMNTSVEPLGEVNILEESFIDWRNSKQNNINKSFTQIYSEKVNLIKENPLISTNKWLYNYQYSGIISKLLNNSKIIHCFRNPLDNILSIYRANFTSGSEYSSSLVDSAKVYLDQEETMEFYKRYYRSKIYDLNYDLLVQNPKIEIRKLIDWLSWEWSENYLSPHLNQRIISTASSIQARSPISSKSVGGWKKYHKLLKPAFEIIAKRNSL